jgi:hypothetical protein
VPRVLLAEKRFRAKKMLRLASRALRFLQPPAGNQDVLLLHRFEPRSDNTLALAPRALPWKPRLLQASEYEATYSTYRRKHNNAFPSSRLRVDTFGNVFQVLVDCLYVSTFAKQYHYIFNTEWIL